MPRLLITFRSVSITITARYGVQRRELIADRDPDREQPGYFDVMGIPLRGRDFRDDENKKESRVAIVNETFVKKFSMDRTRLAGASTGMGLRIRFSKLLALCPTENTTR